ncbi:ERF family protein [Desemzia sp. FAM 23989]|uniref:ERF family protein n=1 Tax=Desemzia sp. FAM 23989 TaxID=3259523 RepID=UPI00388936D0
MSEKTSLVKKLAKITSQIGSVPKTGWNNFNKYNYTTEADIQAITSKKMAEESLVMIPYEVEHSTREVKTRKGNTEYVYQGVWDFEIVDGDTGESIIIRISGEGQDSGDKGPFKALTGAHKYALMKLFQISTGDDPERDFENTTQQQKVEQHQQDYQNQNYQQSQQNYNSQPIRQNYQSQPTPQQQEQELSNAIVGYVKKLNLMGIDIQQVYAYIANKEGVQSVTEVAKTRILGYMKAQYLKLQNNQPKQLQPQQPEFEQGSILQSRTTQPATTVNWGNK